MRRHRRPFLVFGGTLVLACAASLAYVYSRSPEYRATARVQIVPAGDIATGTKIAPDPQAVVIAAQVLTGRPAVEAALGALDNKPPLGNDSVGAAQHMLSAKPLADGIVEISASGADPLFASQLVNAVIAAYRDSAVSSFEARAGEAIAEAKAAADEAAADAAAKREAVESARAGSDTPALEAKQSAIAANIARLNDSYAAAMQKRTEANARLKALTDAEADGHPIVRAKDQPALDDLERQAAPLRDQLQDLQRRFTPAYLALDANTRSLQARVTDLDSRLKAARRASQAAARQEAEADLASADSEVSRLAAALEDNNRAAGTLDGQLAAFDALQEALDKSQTAERAALDRVAKLEANARDRGPKIQILEQAAPNPIPVRPVYTRDAGIAVAGSLFVSLFSTWLGGFVARRREANIGYQRIATPELENYARPLLLQDRGTGPRLVEIEGTVLRELRGDEIAALMKAASDDVRLIAAALLMGMRVDDVVALTWDEGGAVTIGGDPKRRVRIEEPLLVRLRNRAHAEPNTALLRDESGASLTKYGIDGILASAADIAGLDHPGEVTAAALERTYTLFVKRRRRPESRAA